MATPIDIIFCPGLDGSASEIATVADLLLPAAELRFLRYPNNTTADVKGLTSMVASKLRKLPRGARLLAGCSFGGFVATQTALRYPKLVDGLCLIATFNHEPAPISATLGIALAGVLPRSATMLATRVLAKKIINPRMTKPQRAKFADGIAEIDPFAMAARVKLFQGWDGRKQLAEVGIPVEVVYATRDGISGTKAQIAGWSGLRDVRVTGLKSGHVLPLERPKELVEIMTAWMQRVVAGATS